MHPGARGVTTPINQGRPANEGLPNTVVSAMKCEFVAVEYFDHQGRKVNDVLMKAGDEFYMPPGSTVWAESLKSVKPWLKNGILQKLPIDAFDAASAVKVADKVDILVGGPETT